MRILPDEFSFLPRVSGFSLGVRSSDFGEVALLLQKESVFAIQASD